jgi:hypothetical protein
MKRYFGQNLILILIFVSVLTGASLRTVAQQENWKTKNVDQWTEADIDIVLNKSDWVATQEVRLLFDSNATKLSGSGDTPQEIENNRITHGATDTPVDFEFKLRLRSALPIRLALVRQSQIKANYDALSKEERAALDAKLKGLYVCPACTDNYVLTLSSRSKNFPGADAVFSTLKGAKLEDLKRYVYLMSSSGGKRELVHFIPPKAPGDEATFFFRRLDERGKPLFTPADKTLIFRLSDKDNSVTTNFVLDISKIVVGGQVIF